MTSLTMKAKHGKTYIPVEIPTFEKVTAKHLEKFIGMDVVLEFSEGDRKVYGLGNEKMHGAWCKDKVTMTLEDFCTYWQYKMMEYGIDLFSRLEAREERVSIMTTEGMSDKQAHEYCDTKPLMYATQGELPICETA